jgi:hypothetical protein
LTAFALLALVLLPFTRPFSTCPLSVLVGQQTGHWAAGTARGAALDESAPLDSMPTGAVVEEETKDDVLLTAVCLPLMLDAGIPVTAAASVPDASIRRVVPSLRL